MELILKETIDTLGQEGDVVKVKAGYGRNYLLPRKKAVLANTTNLAVLEQGKASINSKLNQQKEEAEALSKKISAATVTIEHRVGEGNKLYGSVTSADITAKLSELGIEIDKKKILLDEPIKTLGETPVQVKVGYQMTTEIKVQVVPQAKE